MKKETGIECKAPISVKNHPPASVHQYDTHTRYHLSLLPQTSPDYRYHKAFTSASRTPPLSLPDRLLSGSPGVGARARPAAGPGARPGPRAVALVSLGAVVLDRLGSSLVLLGRLPAVRRLAVAGRPAHTITRQSVSEID